MFPMRASEYLVQKQFPADKKPAAGGAIKINSDVSQVGKVGRYHLHSRPDHELEKMARAFLSSGDLIADRRASYADMLFETGDHAAAADLMRQALEIVPIGRPGLFRLGEMDAGGGAGRCRG